MWNLNYDTNELIYETETESQTQRTDYGGQDGGGVGEEWIGSLGVADAIYIEQINKVLLYRTGNYIQRPVINHNEKEYFLKDI